MTQTTLHRQAPRGQKIQRRPVHGVLLLDKPLGLSSNQALQKAKWLLRADKAGHTGTLDPLATGVLPLCFGAATKFSQIQLDADKTYEAVLLLGQKTTTADAEGDVIETRPVPAINSALMQALCTRFMGPQTQIPPMYSALKKDGKALYEYARKGEEVEREARHVTISRLSIDMAEDDRGPALKIVVTCSKGTYIRTLAEDIGAALGCGAHLQALQRTGSGPLSLQHAHSIESLEALAEPARDALLLETDALLAEWPVVRLESDEAGRFLSGLRRRVPLPDAPHVRVYGPEPKAFLGGAHIAGGELISTRLLSPLEAGAVQNAPVGVAR